MASKVKCNAYKTCPLKRATGNDVLLFQNVNITEETEREVAELIKKGEGFALRVATDDGPGYVGPAIGHCDREHCGWWDEQKGQCAIVTMANR